MNEIDHKIRFENSYVENFDCYKIHNSIVNVSHETLFGAKLIL